MSNVQLALLIPIIAIVGGVSIPIVVLVLKSQERKLQIHLQMKQSHNALSDEQYRELRAELLQLRDMSTQFSLSMEHAVHRIDQRVENLERKLFGRMETTPIETKADPVAQTIGR